MKYLKTQISRKIVEHVLNLLWTHLSFSNPFAHISIDFILMHCTIDTFKCFFPFKLTRRKCTELKRTNKHHSIQFPVHRISSVYDCSQTTLQSFNIGILFFHTHQLLWVVGLTFLRKYNLFIEYRHLYSKNCCSLTCYWTLRKNWVLLNVN